MGQTIPPIASLYTPLRGKEKPRAGPTDGASCRYQFGGVQRGPRHPVASSVRPSQAKRSPPGEGGASWRMKARVPLQNSRANAVLGDHYDAIELGLLQRVGATATG